MADLWERARQGKPPARWWLRVTLGLAFACLFAVPPATARLREKVLTFRGTALEKVVVEGAQRLQQTDVVAASGLESGTSLLVVDTRRVSDRLARIPWIRSAEVRRRWPREIVIRIVEREPAGQLLLYGEPYLVDIDGSVFKPVEREDQVDLPVISGIVENLLTGGPEQGRSLLKEALSLLARIEASSFGGGASELHRNDGGGYSVVTERGMVVDLGEPGREDMTIAALDRALPGIRERLGEPATVAVMGDGSLAVRLVGRAGPSGPALELAEGKS